MWTGTRELKVLQSSHRDILLLLPSLHFYFLAKRPYSIGSIDGPGEPGVVLTGPPSQVC